MGKSILLVFGLAVLAAALYFVFARPTTLGPATHPLRVGSGQTTAENAQLGIEAARERLERLQGAGQAGGGAEVRPRVPFSDEFLAPFRQALASTDPEGGMIALLDDPSRAQLAVDFLLDLGKESAAKALRELLDKFGDAYAYERPEGTVTRTAVECSLYMSTEINPFPPEEQARRLLVELERLASLPPPSYGPKYVRGDVSDRSRWCGVYLERIKDLAPKEALLVLSRVVEVNEKLIPNQRWLPYGLVAQTVDRIDDPGGLRILEIISHHFVGPGAGGPWDSSCVSDTWWRLKLRVTPQAQWLPLLEERVLRRERRHEPYGSSGGEEPFMANLASAARIIGPACIPMMREIATGRHHGPITRAEAMGVLGAVGDSEFLPLALGIALDRSENQHTRQYATGHLTAYRQRGLDALGKVARQAADDGNIGLLNEALMDIGNGFFRQDARLSSDDRAFVQSLLTHPSELIRGRAEIAINAVGGGP